MTRHQDISPELAALYPRLWRLCLGLTRCRDTAGDLAQDTCRRALEKAAQFRPGTRLDAWVFTIAHRIWLNDMRAQAVRIGRGIVPVEEAGLASVDPPAEANIFHSEVLTHVMALPEAQRITVMLVYVEGFTYAEASEILEIPIGTVMSRLAAARGKLAKTLSDAREAGQ